MAFSLQSIQWFLWCLIRDTDLWWMLLVMISCESVTYSESDTTCVMFICFEMRWEAAVADIVAEVGKKSANHTTQPPTSPWCTRSLLTQFILVSSLRAGQTSNLEKTEFSPHLWRRQLSWEWRPSPAKGWRGRPTAATVWPGAAGAAAGTGGVGLTSGAPCFSHTRTHAKHSLDSLYTNSLRGVYLQASHSDYP